MILKPEDPLQMEFSCRSDLVRDEPLLLLVDDVVKRLDLCELYARYSEGGRAYSSSRVKSKKRKLDELARGFHSQLSEDIAADAGDSDSDDSGDASASSCEGCGTNESLSNATDISRGLSDPDARYMKTPKGGKRLSYNSQIVVDKNQTNCASEQICWKDDAQ